MNGNCGKTYMRALSLFICSQLLAWNAVAADPAFVLQLGTFGEENQAKKHWERVQERYPELMEGLSLRVASVKLPPDNIQVYRTQAGVLPTRSDAEIVCDKLARAGASAQRK